MVYRLLFPTKPNQNNISFLLLTTRIVFGLLFLSHGVAKWNNFEELSVSFPDPLGVGSSVSLGLAIFGELVCSIGFIIGLLYRLAMIPMIFTMAMAFFVIHANDAFAVKEPALVYLLIFILMYIAGPGKFSIDYLIGNKNYEKKRNRQRK